RGRAFYPDAAPKTARLQMAHLKQLIHEIHRRSLWQVLGIYLVGSWLVLQVVDTMVGALNLPDWAPAFALFLLLVGLPIVLATAFVQEGTASTPPEQAGQREQETGATQAGPQHRLFTWRNAIAGGVAAFALWGVVAAGWMLLGSGAESRGQSAVGEAAAIDLRSIAVLPLANRSALEEDAFFVDGIHDDILTQLSQIDGLKVISRTSVMQYRGSPKPIGEIAEDLGVATVLEGAVQRAGERVRVNVQLIDASTEAHLWAETYDEELTAANIFAIQSDIARKIAAALQATLAPEVEKRIEERPTESLEAYELYTRGRYLWNAGSTAAEVEQAAEFFQQAIAADPGYAPAYVGLAQTYPIRSGLLGVLSADEAIPQARAAAERALELDPDLAEAHAALAGVLTQELRFEEAERALLRALQLNPGSAEAHSTYSWVLLFLGRDSESVRMARRAVELDPLSIDRRIDLSASLLFTGDYDGLLDEAARILELEPEHAGAHYFHGGALALKGQLEEAIAALQRSSELDPESPGRRTVLAWAYARDGQRERALEVLADVPEMGTNLKEKALVYGELGELDRAFDYLDRAYAEHPANLLTLSRDPTADSLRQDPRFDELMKKLGLD
ncbi:MAG: tetratricopeptide repeat protein, partial [Gemmatimonadota bacterium]